MKTIFLKNNMNEKWGQKLTAEPLLYGGTFEVKSRFRP